MEDEDKNSKSLVLITRVGSTPTTGIEKADREVFSVGFSFGFFPYRSGTPGTEMLQNSAAGLTVLTTV